MTPATKLFLEIVERTHNELEEIARKRHKEESERDERERQNPALLEQRILRTMEILEISYEEAAKYCKAPKKSYFSEQQLRIYNPDSDLLA